MECMQATAGAFRGVTPVLHVWKVERDGEDERFSCHDSIANRRLLWHGTNVAVGPQAEGPIVCVLLKRWH